MEKEEKLCRSFSRALARLPATMTEDARVLLTPENLALMGTLTTVWLGSQGVPIAGQVVDAALLALGVTLLAGQAVDLTHFLWTFVNRAELARSSADLDESATSLARALSMVGINVVAVILTREAVAKAPRGPPPPTPEFALPQGGRVSAMAMEQAPSSVKAPVVLMAGGSGGNRKPPEYEGRPTKTPDPAAFEKWIRKAQKRALPAKPEEPYGFQRKHAGAEEVLVEGGGESVWADGARSSDAHLIDTKYVEKPDTSPFVVGSACGESVRQIIRKKEAGQFSRYAAIILDSKTPVVGLEIIVNDSRAIVFFESLMQEFRIPGRVVVKQ
jgi:hypothetical protein